MLLPNSKHYQEDYRRDKKQKLKQVERKDVSALANLSGESASNDFSRLTNNRFLLAPARFSDHFVMNVPYYWKKPGRKSAPPACRIAWRARTPEIAA